MNKMVLNLLLVNGSRLTDGSMAIRAVNCYGFTMSGARHCSGDIRGAGHTTKGTNLHRPTDDRFGLKCN